MKKRLTIAVSRCTSCESSLTCIHTASGGEGREREKEGNNGTKKVREIKSNAIWCQLAHRLGREISAELAGLGRGGRCAIQVLSSGGEGEHGGEKEKGRW